MLKKLFGQTAIYGLSSVLVRVFPFFVGPIVQRAFLPAESSPFVDFYSVAGIITVFLTHGMETSFFRFAQEEKDRQKLISTCSLSIIFFSVLYVLLGFVFRQDLANAFQTPDQTNFLVLFLFILSIDALSTIPLSVLRLEKKPMKFLFAKVSGSVIYFLLAVFFLVWLPQNPSVLFGLEYNKEFGVGYVFVANLIQTILTLLVVGKEFVRFKISAFDFKLWKRIIGYSWPIMVAGLAGIVNMTLDRQFLKYFLPEKDAKHQIGVYGAVYKIVTFITVFRQGYQLGIEPYFFSSFKNKDSKKTYTVLMDVFVIFNCIIFLFLMVNLQWISELYLGKKEYYEGIDVVPILLLGAVFLGIYYNLSIWYKLSDRTIVGLYISLIGAIITTIINVIYVPEYGYWASAWAAMITFMSMMIISYLWGKIKYPIPYNVGKILFYLGISLVLAFVSFQYFRENYIVGNGMFLFFVLLVLYFERITIKYILK